MYYFDIAYILLFITSTYFGLLSVTTLKKLSHISHHYTQLSISIHVPNPLLL